jgi:hypothetical protein
LLWVFRLLFCRDEYSQPGSGHLNFLNRDVSKVVSQKKARGYSLSVWVMVFHVALEVGGPVDHLVTYWAFSVGGSNPTIGRGLQGEQ